MPGTGATTGGTLVFTSVGEGAVAVCTLPPAWSSRSPTPAAAPTAPRSPPTAASSSRRTAGSTSPCSPTCSTRARPRPVCRPGSSTSAPGGTCRAPPRASRRPTTCASPRRHHLLHRPRRPPPERRAGRVLALPRRRAARGRPTGSGHPTASRSLDGETLIVVETAGASTPGSCARPTGRSSRSPTAASATGAHSTSTGGSTGGRRPLRHRVRSRRHAGRGAPPAGRADPRHQLLLRRGRPAHAVRHRRRVAGPRLRLHRHAVAGPRSTSGPARR